MLSHQQSCRNEHGYLLAVLDCLESSSHRNLSFSVTHISCQKAIHGYWLFHISFDFVYGCQLVWGFLKLKGFFELVLPRSIGCKGISFGVHSSRVELDKVNRDFANCLASVAFSSCPIRTSKLRNHRRFPANVASEHVELISWNKQCVFWVAALWWRVLNQKIFPLMLS